jgi:cytochrome c556
LKKTLLALSLLAVTATAAFAADDPIADRKALMQANGAAAGAAAGLMKNQIVYAPAIGRTVIASFNATAHTFGDYFPDGSDMGADTHASPKIWEDRAGFDAELAKFQTVVAAAMQASGRDGPADLDAFKAAVGPVFGSCKSCHEGYQVRQ